MGKGSGDTTSTGTTYTSNIPEYAKSYVETMLGATQKQLFEGNTDEGGNFNITGFKPYQPYSRSPSDYIAGFSPLQQQAFSGIGGLGPAQQIGQGSALAGASALGGLDVAGQANPYGFQQQVGGYMNPYLQGALAPQLAEASRQYDIAGTRQQAAATQAGAFGGSREAIMAAENERGRQAALQGIIGQGYNQAFNQAQNQYNQSMQTRLAGLGMAGQAAGQLGQLGQTQFGQQTGIIGLQGQMGAQQQALEQQKINQSIQDYANAQQYPLMQLGVMSNMLRGLPMQATTTNQYVAAPNALTQGIGAAGAAASIYNATKAEGGVIKSMAKGGIASVPSYDVGGEVKDQLASMDIPELEKQARESSSPAIREMARELLREKKMARATQDVGPVGPMGISYQAPQMASGGIIAFAKPEEENNYSLVKDSFMDRINAAAAARPLSTRLSDNSGAPPVTTQDAGGTPSPRVFNTLPEIAAMQAEADKQSALGNRDVEALAAEKEAAMGVNVGAREQRAKIMSERANLADETQRQRYMRLAQFFSKWGSTPGPILVAGMNALNDKLPDIIEDERVLKKARREIDKTIYDIDNATRLEKMGYKKEAQADIQKAADRALELNKYIGNNATQLERERLSNISAEARATAQNISTEKIASKRETDSAADRAVARENLNLQKTLAASDAAKRDLAEALSRVQESQNRDKPYTDAKKIVDEYNSMIEKNKDKKNYQPSPQMTADAKRAEETILKREAADEERLKILRGQVVSTQERLNSLSNPSGKGKGKLTVSNF